jgi:hypothetical protein
MSFGVDAWGLPVPRRAAAAPPVAPAASAPPQQAVVHHHYYGNASSAAERESQTHFWIVLSMTLLGLAIAVATIFIERAAAKRAMAIHRMLYELRYMVARPYGAPMAPMG